MFYSFGYNPSIDGPLLFNLTSIIQTNPSRTLLDTVQIQTYELIEQPNTSSVAKYGLVDETIVQLEGLLYPGSLTDVKFETDSQIAGTFPVYATVSFTVVHSLQAGANVIIELPPDFGIA